MQACHHQLAATASYTPLTPDPPALTQMLQLRKPSLTSTCSTSEPSPPTTVLTRRTLMTSCIALAPLLTQLHSAQQAGAAELQQLVTTQSQQQPSPSAAFTTAAVDDPACASCVGYVDGTLGSCSAVELPCSSSYDDRPAHFVAPWSYDGATAAALQKLVDTLEGCGARVQQRTADYVYAVLEPDGPGNSLDLEFVFAPNDTTVG